MRKIEPIGYDPAHDLVLVPGGGCKKAWFIEQAVTNHVRYGAPELLLWAIDNDLPGLMENDDVKRVLKLLVSGENIRPKGVSTSGNLIADNRKEEILKGVWFHHGRGLGVFTYTEHEYKRGPKKETACDIVAHDLGVTADYVYKVWKELGGMNPEGTLKIVSKFCYIEGQRSLTNESKD